MRRRRPRALLSIALVAVAASASTATASVSSGAIASNQTSASRPETPWSRLPWVVLSPDETFDGDVVNGEDSCLGLLISRRAALMAASCVAQYQAKRDATSVKSLGSVAVALAPENEIEVTDITRSSGSLRHWRQREVANVTIHPLYETDRLAYDVALVEWGDAIDTKDAVTLDSNHGQLHYDTDRITTVQDVDEKVEAAVLPSRSPVCPVGLECVEATWNSKISCSNVTRRTGYVYRLADNRVVVSGLVTQVLDCSDSDAASAPETRSHVAVVSLANARSFIDSMISDINWTDRSPGPLGSESSSGGDTAVDVATPIGQDGSEGDGSSAGNVPGDGDVDFVGDTSPSTQAWRPNLQDKLGYLSRHGDLPDDVEYLTDGGVAVIIAPRFVLTRASWILGLEKVEWVYFASKVIRIKRVEFHEAEETHDQANRLVVVELDHELDSNDMGMVEIATTLPPKYKELRGLATAVFSNSGLVTTAYNALDDHALCGLPENTTDDFVCVVGSERATAYRSLLPFNASFLLMDQFLVGLSRSPSTTGSDQRLAQVFEPLGASDSIRSFLDSATNGTVVWTEKNVYWTAVDPLIYGEMVLHSNGSLKDSLLPCGVVPLTRRYFLTTASCLGSRQASWVVYKPSEDPTVDDGGAIDLNVTAGDEDNQKQNKQVSQKKTQLRKTTQPIQQHHARANESTSTPPWRPQNALAVRSVHVHPIYETVRSPKYDFAIIECEQDFDVSGFLTVRLMGEPLAPHARVVEHVLGGNSADDEASLVVDATECANADAATNDAVCVAATAPSARCPNETVATSLPSMRPHEGDHIQTRSLFYRVGYDVMFVGFFQASQATSASCDARRAYSQVSAIINFVNAIVAKPAWGTSQAEANAADYKVPGFAAPAQIRRPYVVGLRLTKSGQNFCGGSLIAPQFVLTAAHCVTDGLASWVAIGSSVSSGLDTQPIPIDKSRTRIHPQYQSPYAYSHDAAILELAVPAYEAAIALDTSQDFTDGASATMYGYGVESATSTVLSPTLHARKLALLSRKTCARTLPNIDDAVVCALAASGLDACTGDSGSPLVVPDDAAPGGERLVGVVSAGYGCGIAGVPGLYTRVSAIAEFVNAYAVSPIWVGNTPGEGETIDDEPRTRSPSAPTPAVTSFPVSGGGTTQTPSTTQGGTGGVGSPGAGSDHTTSAPSTDVSQLPLEDRNGNPSVPASSVVASTLTPANPTGATSTFVAAVRKTLVPANTLTARTKAELLQFLLGDYPYSFVAPQLLDALASPTNTVTFFSSGDVRPIMAALAAHDVKPLNQRRGRFPMGSPTPGQCP